MAVESLKYRPGAQPAKEDKFGYVVFSGAAHEYHHWHFRSHLKLKASKPEDEPKVLQSIVENLQGDALDVAKEIGIEKLLAEGGPKLLNDAMIAYIFPVARHEAKHLYREGHKTREGVFTRQPGESMQSIILRRKRWWTLLQALDPEVKMSTEHLGDMLLDSVGIADWQKQMVLTSTANSTALADVEKALMEQLGTVHRKEKAHDSRQPSRFRKPFHKPFRRSAYIAAGEADAESPEDEDDDDKGFDDDGEEEEQEEEEVENEILAMELNLLGDAEEVAYLTQSEPSAEMLAKVVQTEIVALAAWSDIGKGKHVSGKSFGKGSKGEKGGGKRRKEFPRSKFGVKSNGLSLEERKKRLARLKAQTKCSACGEKGHWAADPQCKKNSQKAIGAPTAHIAVQDYVDDGYGDECDGTLYAAKEEGQANVATTPEQDQSAAGSTASTGMQLGPETGYHLVTEMHPQGCGPAAPATPMQVTQVSQEERDTRTRTAEATASATIRATAADAQKRFSYGPFKGETYGRIAQCTEQRHVDWIAEVRKAPESKRPAYQEDFLNFLDKIRSAGPQVSESSTASPSSQTCPPGRCKFKKTRGTNAYVSQLICTVCGFRKTERNDDLGYLDSESCPHARLSNLKSSKTDVCSFCMDCGTIIERKSRKEHEQSLAAARAVENASSRVQTVAAKMNKDTSLQQSQVTSALQAFNAHVGKLLTERPLEPVLSSELHELLQNCIDIVEEAKPTAMVSYVPTAMTTTGANAYVPDLPIVDLETSPHVWGILDTACNASVHSTGWRLKAMKVWHASGLGCKYVHQNHKNYGGLNGPETALMVGKVLWPMLLIAKKDGDNGRQLNMPHFVQATTNEISGNTNLLIGLDLQRHLNLRLDVISNRCDRLGKSGEWLRVPMGQVAGSGLLCIRVDGFAEHMHRCPSIGRCALPLTLLSLGDEAIPLPNTEFAAVASEPVRKSVVKKDLEPVKNTLPVSCSRWNRKANKFCNSFNVCNGHTHDDEDESESEADRVEDIAYMAKRRRKVESDLDFRSDCDGRAIDYIKWTKKNMQRFLESHTAEPAELSLADFEKFLLKRQVTGVFPNFEEKDLGHLLHEPVKQDGGWYRMEYSPLVPYKKSEKGNWQKAFHGTEIERLYSIMKNRRLEISESSKQYGLEGFFCHGGDPVTGKKDTSHKSGSYIGAVDLTGNGVFYQAKIELMVDRSRGRSKGDQWIQPPETAKIMAIWIRPIHAKDIEYQTMVNPRWSPLAETNPDKPIRRSGGQSSTPVVLPERVDSPDDAEKQTWMEKKFEGLKLSTYSIGVIALGDHKPLKKFVDDQLGGDWYSLRVNHPPHRRKIDEAYKALYPEAKAKRVFYLECRGLRDPDGDRKLRRHTGSHIDIMEATVANARFPEIVSPVIGFMEEIRKEPAKKYEVVSVCQKGTHRSEVIRHLITAGLRDCGCKVKNSQALSCRNCLVDENCEKCDVDKWSNADVHRSLPLIDKTADILRGGVSPTPTPTPDEEPALPSDDEDEESEESEEDKVKDRADKQKLLAKRESAFSAGSAENLCKRESRVRRDDSSEQADEATLKAPQRRRWPDKRGTSLGLNDIEEWVSVDDAYALVKRLSECFTPGTSYLEASHVHNATPWDAIRSYGKEFSLPDASILGMIKTCSTGAAKKMSDENRATSSSTPLQQQQQEQKSVKRLREDADGGIRRRNVSLKPREDATAKPADIFTNEYTMDTRKFMDTIDVKGKEVDVEWTPTGIPKIDFSPAEERNSILDAIANSRGRSKRFQTYILGPEDAPKDRKVRVDVKFKPHETRVGVPAQMENYRKTSLVKHAGKDDWIMVEDRVGARECSVLDKEVQVCMVFMQEPRYWKKAEDGEVTDVAFFSMSELLECDDESLKMTTMNKRQKKIIGEGVQELRNQDDATRRCLAPGGSVTTMMMIITVAAFMPFAKAFQNATVCEVGSISSGEIEAAKKQFASTRPPLVLSYLGQDNERKPEEVADLYWLLHDFASSGANVVHLDEQYCSRWIDTGTMPVTHCRGNLSFITNSPDLRSLIENWAWSDDGGYAPRSVGDLESDAFQMMISQAHLMSELDCLARNEFPAAYVAEEAEENQYSEKGFLDDPSKDEECHLPKEIEEALLKEESVLEEIPLPGVPDKEKSRRANWIKIPRSARTAIRKMHNEWGHLPKSVLLDILKTARAPIEFIKAAEEHLCRDCEAMAQSPQTTKVGKPSMRYRFNEEIGIDVFDLHDYDGKSHLFLNIVCMGTDFQVVAYLCPGTGTPSSRLCADTLLSSWVTWAGWPRDVVADRGLHNRGYFSRMLGAHGICPRNVGLESPEMLGKVEKKGGDWKRIGKKAIHAQKLKGEESMKQLAFCLNTVVNDGCKKGGFAPSQWVLGKFPRSPGDMFCEEEFADLGCITEKVDAESAFYNLTQIRLECKRAFAEADCSKKVANIQLRKAAPVPAKYKVGDLISFKRDANRSGKERWSTVTRIIGFDGPKVVWGLNETLPVCLAIDKIRPATPSQALAHMYLHGRGLGSGEVPNLESGQQRYVDEINRVAVSEDVEKPAETTKVAEVVADETVVENTVVSEQDPSEHEFEQEAESETPETAAVNASTTDMTAGSSSSSGNTVKRRVEVIENLTKRRAEVLDDVPLAIKAHRTEEAKPVVDDAKVVVPRQTRSQELLDDLKERKRSRSRDRDKELQAFIAERVEIPTKLKGNQRKKAAGKVLRYENSSEKVKRGIDESRKKEWKKWMDFGAGVRVQGEVLDELLQEGHRIVPMQWIDTDKREHLARPGIEHDPEIKSRLVACGQHENRTGIRSDSPTCDVEGLNMICSFAASKKLRIRCADLKNAYFQGMPLDRVLLLGAPKGGLPGEDDSVAYAIAANLPVYGTGDAGRRFYKVVRVEAIKSGMTENMSIRSLYTVMNEKGEVVLMFGAHVDDILYACEEEYQHVIDDFLAKFEVKEIHEGKFRFCGREYEQFENFDIMVTCRNNTEKILPINFFKGDRTGEDPASQGEISQLRSVNGSMSWVARQVRPEKTYVCGKLQGVATVAQVKHLEECNLELQDMKSTAERGIFYKAGVLDFNKAPMLTISDASWANDEKIVDDKIFPRRSQYGRMHLLASDSLWDGDEGHVHFIGWKSGLIKRTCRSTFRAETQGMTYATEESDRLRAVLTAMHGQFKKKNWEAHVRQCRRSVWMTDCQSLYDYLVNPVAAGCEDKRLEIDLLGLRESLWEWPDGTPKDEITEGQTDKPRWIDTSAMICDPLTKRGPGNFANRLVATMMTGVLNVEATPESKLRKMRQQKARLDRILPKD